MVSASLLALALAAGAEGATIQDLVEAPHISGIAISPDHRWVAFQTAAASIPANGYDLRWWVVPVDGHQPAHQIGSGGQALYSLSGALDEQTPIWSPNSDALFYRAAQEAEVQIWRASLKGGDARPVTSLDGDVASIDPSPDGTRINYRIGPPRSAIRSAERAAVDDGILVDSTIDIAQPLEKASWINGRLAAQRITGNWFTRGGILSQAPERTGAITMAVGGPHPIAPIRRSRVEKVTDPVSGPMVRHTDATGRVRSWTPIGDNRLDWVAPIDGDRVAIASLDAFERDHIAIWTPSRGSVRPLTAGKGLMRGSDIWEKPCADVRNSLICVSSSATEPSELVRIDLGSGKHQLLFDPAPDLKARAAIRSEPLRWSWEPGKSVTGILLLPSSSKPKQGFPLVVNYYVCPGFLRGGVGDELPMQPLTRAGIAVLCVNSIRGVDAANIPKGYQDGVKALTAILDILSTRRTIDPAHIGMSGLSFGSEMTMAMVRKTKFLSAAAISSAQIEPGYYWLNAFRGPSFTENLDRFWALKSPDATPLQWQTLSSALNTKDIRVPLLMQLPENEARNSMELFTRLKQENKPVELIVFPHEAHIKEEPRHKYAVYRRNLDWFRFWLQGYIDPDPSKATQYERWRALASIRSLSASSFNGSNP